MAQADPIRDSEACGDHRNHDAGHQLGDLRSRSAMEPWRPEHLERGDGPSRAGRRRCWPISCRHRDVTDALTNGRAYPDNKDAATANRISGMGVQHSPYSANAFFTLCRRKGMSCMTNHTISASKRPESPRVSQNRKDIYQVFKTI